MKTLWFDLTNAPHVHFFAPIVEKYRASAHIVISVRDYSETVELARSKFREQCVVIGAHGGGNRLKKISKMLARLNLLRKQIGGFDFAISCGGFEASLYAKIRHSVSVVFDDNDLSPNWMYSRFADHVFFPEAVNKETLLKQGFRSTSTYQYEGYKEDMYIADYEPDANFPETLPFDNYVVIRPENTMASYLNSNIRSIVPQLLYLFINKGYNVLYFPRTDVERRYAYGLNNVYVPREPVNGLDAAFFSQAVLSGAGSLTREAACLGRPAVSFYAGERLLAVDQRMIEDSWLFHSRDPIEIIAYVRRAGFRKFDRVRSKRVQESVFRKLDEILIG